MAELQVTVDKTFVPMQISGGASKDPRELGVRVFHAFIHPVELARPPGSSSFFSSRRSSSSAGRRFSFTATASSTPTRPSKA